MQRLVCVPQPGRYSSDRALSRYHGLSQSSVSASFYTIAHAANEDTLASEIASMRMQRTALTKRIPDRNVTVLCDELATVQSITGNCTFAE